MTEGKQSRSNPEDSNLDDKTCCWACKTELRCADQHLCQACHRWQTFPWKYLNVSSAAVAVIAALVSTWAAVYTAYSSHVDKSHFDFFIKARSITQHSGNIELLAQNYSRHSVVIDKTGLCSRSDGSGVQFEIVLADRFRLFSPEMPNHIENRYFEPRSPVALEKGDEFDCTIGLRNANNFEQSRTIRAKVN